MVRKNLGSLTYSASHQFFQLSSWILTISMCLMLGTMPAQSQVQPQSEPLNPNNNELDLSPEIIEGSPVLQRWRRQVP
ncbi:MAG TPA: hypothetical protein V6D12_19410, partial [Candidatus Obscuribacterales bacterium]